GVYFVSPRLMAATAASLMFCGVSKSGSPTESEMTSLPFALRSRAICVTAMVAEGLMRERASARKAMIFCPEAVAVENSVRRGSRSKLYGEFAPLFQAERRLGDNLPAGCAGFS